MVRPGVLLVVAVTVLFLALGGCGASTDPEVPAMSSSEQPVTSLPTESIDSAPASQPFVKESFSERRTIHFVSSDPANNSLLTIPPARVSITFDYDLGGGSFMSVKRDELDVTRGPMVMSPDRRTLSAEVEAGVTGNYAVDYAAYFSDGYYEEGRFGFSVHLQD